MQVNEDEPSYCRAAPRRGSPNHIILNGGCCSCIGASIWTGLQACMSSLGLLDTASLIPTSVLMIAMCPKPRAFAVAPSGHVAAYRKCPAKRQRTNQAPAVDTTRRGFSVAANPLFHRQEQGKTRAIRAGLSYNKVSA